MPSYAKFQEVLKSKHNIKNSLFWMKQYAMYQNKIRDVRMHSITLIELSINVNK